VLAAWSGGQLTAAQVHEDLAVQLRDMEVHQQLERYELISRALDASIEAALLEEARVAAGLPTIDLLLEAEVARRLVEPPLEEVNLELERMELQLGGGLAGDPAVSREQMRSSLIRAMMGQQEEDARASYLEDLKAARGVKLYLPYPEVPRVSLDVAPHNPVVGPPDAPVTVVQFIDFQCYYCRRASPIIERLLAERPELVRVVFKSFPLPGHPAAVEAAVAAHCADRQGRYLQMSAILHRHLDHLEPLALRRYAGQVGLDVEGWDECFADPAWRDRVEQDAHEGRAAGVDSTPTFFVNGLMVAGSIPYGRLLDLVDREGQRVQVAAAGAR
jgi:protein-disulfide isomerase